MVEIWEDTALWTSIDEERAPLKKFFGPRAIVYGGWFFTCAETSFVCINDLSSSNRGAQCVYDCTQDGAPLGGRFSPSDVREWIKQPPLHRTDKTYHPRLAEVITKATNLEQSYKASGKPVDKYFIEQGTTRQFLEKETETEDGEDLAEGTSESSTTSTGNDPTGEEEDFIAQPPVILMATAWLPN